MEILNFALKLVLVVLLTGTDDTSSVSDLWSFELGVILNVIASSARNFSSLLSVFDETWILIVKIASLMQEED